MTNPTLTAPAMIRLDGTPPTPSPALRVRLTPAGPALWRVLDAAGRIVGHLHRLDHTLGSRWSARRYRDGVKGFRTVGEFWSVDEAISALRNG
ncbi:hypothetical protein MIC448_70018 [Microbacterium sp. C448]|uniref:hypothetical protein n=1 Tax=Microbacterium TaxID=33882 RepID=UPI0003DE356E|nr:MULTISPECIES: hypothetical protein [Microbacterium]CDK01517.1 hypothetical protein MIC448_70018 [Microbacterium sp. C448]